MSEREQELEQTIDDLRRQLRLQQQKGEPALTEEEFTKRVVEIETKIAQLETTDKTWRGDYNRLIGYYYGMLDTHLGLRYSGPDMFDLNWKEHSPKVRLFVIGEKK
jgi:hypothetical protein